MGSDRGSDLARCIAISLSPRCQGRFGHRPPPVFTGTPDMQLRVKWLTTRLPARL